MKCDEKPITKTDVTQFYKRHSREDRQEAINALLENNLIELKKRPKAGTHKAPTFYFITQDGKIVLNQYKEGYPWAIFLNPNTLPLYEP